MSSFSERASMIAGASCVVESEYLTADERIAIARLNEMYESYKRDLDPDFQGISFVAWAKAAKDVPEGVVADVKFWETVNLLLMSGKFGEIDWKL